MTELTEEQQAIVDHDYGPALVFAVAGAGKTTAAVHRIERLVRERIFTPKSILATSFSKAAVNDIKKALAPWPHCGGVKVATLHSVGNSILMLARKCGHLTQLGLMEDETDNAGALVLSRTLARARREEASYRAELETLDREDFLNYVGACKANLLYADLEKAGLPQDARRVAGQAPAPPAFPWYLRLYDLYERVRLQDDMLTFDDQLMTGWECLVRFPDVLAQMQGRYRCVMVDEFQDVSLAQAEILDLITDLSTASPCPDGPRNYENTRNYMAIGDDDQTIYEWRGADTGFILNFADRYGARKYFISDNFRSQAAHLALANRVIERNVKREPKRLSLTRGFGGGVHVHRENSGEATGVHIAQLIEQAFHDGHTPADIAVLVRLYAQTPFIEHALIERRIPYRIVGSTPFYQRFEVVTLLDYVRLALLERQLQSGLPLTDEQVADCGGRWKQVVNRPVRFVSQALSDSVWRSVTLHGATLSRAILVASGEASDRVARNMQKLATDLKWAAAALEETPASDLLAEMDRRLGYTDYLKVSSGFPETGEARAANVRAFIAYAREKGNATQFLAHLDYISFSRIGRGDAVEGETIPIMTAFRAKGLQWPVVFVPDCNQGTFPYRTEEGLEEERRLFYVAITRPQEHLHLHYVQGRPLSQFLQGADWEATLAAVEAVGTALERKPTVWRTQDALALARHTASLGLERYFQTWWGAPEEQACGIAHRVQALFQAAKRRGLGEALGLRAEHRSLWEMFGPPEQEPGEEDFADLHLHVPKPPEPEAVLEPITTEGAAAPAGGWVFEVGDQVRHWKFGEGVILARSGPVDNPRLEISFGENGTTVLLAKFAQLEHAPCR